MVLSEGTPLLSSDAAVVPSPPPRRRRVLKLVLCAVLLVGIVLIVLAAALRRLAAPATASATTANGYICGTTKNEAGYITLANKKDDHYFYWFFESQSLNPSKDPLVIWLTGGPGASSLYALLTENGPCTINSDLTTTNNAYAWTNKANVIWLDQPTGVGFSYGAAEDADVDGTNVGENLYWFLQGFIEKHPEFDNRKFFLFGESYGGHYVPSGAHYIWQQSKLGSKQPGSKRINLQGIGIGNGWVDPETQYLYADAMAHNAYNISFLNDSQIAQMKKDSLVCVELSLQCRKNPGNGSICLEEQDFSYEKHLLPFFAAKRNPYDIREACDTDVDPSCHRESIALMTEFLNSDKVRRYLNVNVGPDKQWEEVNGDVNRAFIMSGDNAQPSQLQVAELLNDGIRVLVYNGDADLMCNWQSSHAWTRALNWNGAEGFNAAKERHFFAEDANMAGAEPVDAGIVRSFGNFTFLRVFNAGHMVPKNQPAAALDMLNKFLCNHDLA